MCTLLEIKLDLDILAPLDLDARTEDGKTTVGSNEHAYQRPRPSLRLLTSVVVLAFDVLAAQSLECRILVVIADIVDSYAVKTF